MTKSVYTAKVRDKALAMIEASSVEEVASNLKIAPSTLHKWRSRKKLASAKVTPVVQVRDAIVFLRHARRAIAKRGETALSDPVAGYVLLALNTLEGRA